MMIKKNTLISSVVLTLALGVFAGWVLHRPPRTITIQPTPGPRPLPSPFTNGSHIKATGGSLTFWSTKSWVVSSDKLSVAGAVSQILLQSPGVPVKSLTLTLNPGWHVEIDFFDRSGNQHPDKSHVTLIDRKNNTIELITTKPNVGNFTLDYTLKDTAVIWYGKHYVDGPVTTCRETCNHLKTIEVFVDDNPLTAFTSFQCPNGQCEIDLQ